MSVIEALILGILQGVTEFIPVSSSGHLVLFQKIFKLSEGVFEFDIIVHFATSLAVIWVFHKEIYGILRDVILTCKLLLFKGQRKVLNEGTKLALLIIAGSIPTFLIAVAFKSYFKEAFETGKLLGVGFIITGLILWYAEKGYKSNKNLKSAGLADSVFIGTMQGIAILPGISRSGSTISAALLRGLNRDFAARFSFLLSLPVILGAALLETVDFIKDGAQMPAIPQTRLVVGFIASLLSGYAAVKFMLRVVSKGKFKGFAYYMFAIGIAVLSDQLFFNILFSPLF